MNKTLSKLIDNCVDYNSEYNISLAIHHILKNNYRYIGYNKWEYFDNHSKSWIIDINNKYLKRDIETNICNEFLNRIKYLIYKSNLEHYNNNLKNDYELKINKLLICSNKLKNKKYIIIIIKEARSLFEYDKY